MKGFGFFLLVIGAAIAAGSLLMPTTAPIEVPSGSLYGLPTRPEVYNLGLLQHQMMVFVIGCAIAVLGGALAAIGHLGERLLPPEELARATAALTAPIGTPDDMPTSVDHVAGNADSEMGWIIGVGAVALLIAFFAILAGSTAGNSSVPATVADLNVTDETATDNMTAVDAGLAPKPTPSAMKSPESAPPADDGTEIGRDNWGGE